MGSPSCLMDLNSLILSDEDRDAPLLLISSSGQKDDDAPSAASLDNDSDSSYEKKHREFAENASQYILEENLRKEEKQSRINKARMDKIKEQESKQARFKKSNVVSFSSNNGNRKSISYNTNVSRRQNQQSCSNESKTCQFSKSSVKKSKGNTPQLKEKMDTQKTLPQSIRDGESTKKHNNITIQEFDVSSTDTYSDYESDSDFDDSSFDLNFVKKQPKLFTVKHLNRSEVLDLEEMFDSDGSDGSGPDSETERNPGRRCYYSAEKSSNAKKRYKSNYLNKKRSNYKSAPKSDENMCNRSGLGSSSQTGKNKSSNNRNKSNFTANDNLYNSSPAKISAGREQTRSNEVNVSAKGGKNSSYNKKSSSNDTTTNKRTSADKGNYSFYDKKNSFSDNSANKRISADKGCNSSVDSQISSNNFRSSADDKNNIVGGTNFSGNDEKKSDDKVTPSSSRRRQKNRRGVNSEIVQSAPGGNAVYVNGVPYEDIIILKEVTLQHKETSSSTQRVKDKTVEEVIKSDEFDNAFKILDEDDKSESDQIGCNLEIATESGESNFGNYSKSDKIESDLRDKPESDESSLDNKSKLDKPDFKLETISERGESFKTKSVKDCKTEDGPSKSNEETLNESDNKRGIKQSSINRKKSSLVKNTLSSDSEDIDFNAIIQSHKSELDKSEIKSNKSDNSLESSKKPVKESDSSDFETELDSFLVQFNKHT